MSKFLRIEELDKFGASDKAKALNDIKSHSTIFDELNKVQACEYRFFYFTNDNGSLSYNYVYIFIIGTNTRITAHKGQYSFFNTNIHNYHRLSNTEISELGELAVKPNYIGYGKLTTKKIDAWLLYGQALEILCFTKQTEYENNETEFRKTLEGQKVVYWGDGNNKGYIEKNGLTYEFEIGRNYINTKIKLTAYVNDLNSFLQLSDNKFTK